MKPVRLIFFVIIYLNAYSVVGQIRSDSLKRRCPINTLNFENGLLNNATTAIITDVFGFTWVSTKTGLQRFNGYTLETITPVVNKDTFNINNPVYFFGLKNGSIWISFKEGVLEYDPGSNSFHLVISYHSNANLHYSIIPLKETIGGIWCIQENKGIVLYNRKGIVTQQYSFFDADVINDIIKTEQTQYSNSFASNNKFIYINSTATKRILSINVINHQPGYIKMEGVNIRCLACNHDRLYILSDSNLICENINSGEKIKSINLRQIYNENIYARSLGFADNNQLLVSANNHLFQLDTNCVYHFEITDLNRNPILESGSIFKIYADEFRRIWVLTNNDIKRIQNREIAFAHFIYPGAKSNFVRTIYFDEQKNYILAGSFNSGIQLYDTLANSLWNQPLKTPNVKDVIAIEKLTADEYLVITFVRGWYLLKLSARQIAPFPMKEDVATRIRPTLTNFCNNVQRINDTTIFIATATNVFRCIFHKTKLISAEPMLGFDTNNSIDCFLYSADKTLWTGTNSGLLYRLNNSGPIQTINIPENYLVRSIAEDMQHHIYVGTDKGLYIYTNSGVFIKKITRETGLLNDCIYSILPATNVSAVFAGSNMGLSYIPLNGTIKNFSKEMGLQENEFNSGSSFKSLKGKLYFGGVNGITAFYPGSMSGNTDIVVLNIIRLEVNDSSYNSSAGTWQGDSILLNYKQDHLRFDFAAMGLLNANAYVYQYRMNGLEKQWQMTYRPNGINYTLQPGKYILEIKCHPILSANPTFYKRFFILIRSPWWQTLWFRIAAFIMAVAVIGFIIQQYNHRKYQRKIRSLQMHQEIQHERERISRDLHDNMGAYATAIIANIDEMIENKKMNETSFSQLKRNAREIMVNLRDTIWALNNENITIAGISDHFKGYVQKISPSYPDKNFEVNETIINDIIFSPVQGLNIFRIMQEAFTNALKHSNCNAIKVSITSDDTFLIIISDDGIGINKNNLHTGNGIENMYSRAKESGLLFTMNNREEKGTEIILSSGSSTIN